MYAVQSPQKVGINGLKGWISKVFFGKGFENEVDDSLEIANNQMKLIEKQNQLIIEGISAEAIVTEVKKTGKLLNFTDPILTLKLKVIPNSCVFFEIETTMAFSNLTIPQEGQRIEIKYDPQDKSSIVIL